MIIANENFVSINTFIAGFLGSCVVNLGKKLSLYYTAVLVL